MEKRKAGRPPVDRESRSERMEIRLMPEEKRLFEQAADLSGLPVSDWVRQTLTETAKHAVSQANTD